MGSEGDEAAWVDDMLADEIIQFMWLQRRYQARGQDLPVRSGMRTPTNSEVTWGGARSKNSVGSSAGYVGSTPSSPANHGALRCRTPTGNPSVSGQVSPLSRDKFER